MSANFFKWNKDNEEYDSDEYTNYDQADDLDMEESEFWLRRPEPDNYHKQLKRDLANILKAMEEEDTLECIRLLFEPKNDTQ